MKAPPVAQHAWGPTDAALQRRGDAATAQPRRSRDRGTRRSHEERAASLEAQLAGASLDDGVHNSRAAAAAAPSFDIEALVQPLADEVERLQARVLELEEELNEERQRSRGTERRLRAHIQALLDERGATGEEPAGAMALPPAAHPFWRQPEAPATAIRMLADAESARALGAAQLEAALEARRSLAAQLDVLTAKHRALQSHTLSLEVAGTSRRGRGAS